MLNLPMISRHLLLPLAALSALLAGAACGGSGGSNTGGGGSGTGGHVSTSSSSSSGTMSSSSGTGGQAPTCPGMGYAGGEKTTPGGSVTATIVDQNGAPVAGQPVYICGTDVCSDPGMTGSDGKVSISTTLMMKKAAFKFGDALAFSELAIPLSMASSDFGTLGTAKLPSAGAAFAPGMDAASGGVTVSVPAGGAVTVNELVYDTPDKQQLRAALLPLTNEGPVFAPVMINGAPPGFEVLYGVAPAGTLLCPAAKVTIPNSASWPANTMVEFWVMTVDAGQEYAPYAGWAKASDGVVSGDGQTVSTVDGGGFIYLDNFAVRKKP
jgi:hypothetical protein